VLTPRYERLLDRFGYARFRHWRIYGERGLSGKRATLWLYEDHLALQFTDALLAEHGVEHEEQ
jgi:hypothetical protein